MSRSIYIATTPWSYSKRWTATSLCAQAELAESIGLHSFWLPENHFGGDRSIPSPLTWLAAVAARTQRIKLGCTSYLLPIRHPLQAAEEVAVLDQLSEGRVILGVGRGTQTDMFDAFSVSAKEKRKLFQEKLEIMLSAWRGDSLAKTDADKPVVLAPSTVQQPHPPIWVAAFGPLALKQAATLGFPYLASPIEPLAVLESNYRAHREHLADAGHKPLAITPVMRTVFITETATQTSQLSEQLQKTIPPALKRDDAAVEDWAIVGERSYCRDKLAEYVSRLDLTHLIVRGGIRGVDDEDQIKSFEALMAIASSLTN